MINNKLAEIFFERKNDRFVIYGHCWVKRSEYKTKKELKWIDEDIKRVRLTYWKERYRNKFTDEIYPVKEFETDGPYYSLEDVLSDKESGKN